MFTVKLERNWYRVAGCWFVCVLSGPLQKASAFFLSFFERSECRECCAVVTIARNVLSSRQRTSRFLYNLYTLNRHPRLRS
jgi:hypothetical protein